MLYAIVVTMYDRGGEDEIDRVLIYNNRELAVNSMQELAKEIIHDFEWDDPLLGHEITSEDNIWCIDGEPVFALSVRPIENRRYNTGK